MNYPYYTNQLFGSQQPQFQQPQQDERIWVQGIEGANAYLVAPGGFVRLWDSQSNTFYEKHTDASGRPYTEIFEYTKKSDQRPQVAVPSSYDSQIEELEKRVTALEKMKKGAKKDEPIPNDTSV